MRWTTQLVIALLVTIPAWAGEPASLSTAGKVWTNAVLLPSGATVHVGDHVETGADSTAVISSASTGRIEVREKSSVDLGQGEVILYEGVVSTAKGGVRLGDVHIEPKESAGTLIVVSHRDRRTLIAVHRGDALITQPGSSQLLLAGGSYAVPAAGGRDGTSEEENKKDDSDDKGAATPAGSSSGGGATQAGGWTIGSLSHAGSIAIVAAAGAAAVGTAMVGFALTEDSPSPSTAP